MSVPPTRNTSFIRRAWKFFASKWIAEVPADIACCEFDCRKLHCDQGEWETCEHRINYMNAGQQPAEQESQQDEVSEQDQVSDTGSEQLGDVTARK